MTLRISVLGVFVLFIITTSVSSEHIESEILSNNISSENDFIFTLVHPKIIQSNKPFRLVLTLLQAAHPVLFNFTFVNADGWLSLPSIKEFPTEKYPASELHSFNIYIPEPEKNSKNDLKLIVTANYVGLNSTVQKVIPLQEKPKPSSRILIQTNKDEYIVGDKVEYHIIVTSDSNEKKDSAPKRLNITFLDSNNHPVWYRCKSVDLPSSGVYNGSFVVQNDGTNKLLVTLEDKSTVVSEEEIIHQINSRDNYQQNDFRVKITSEANHMFFPESKMKVDISFSVYDKTGEALPIDGLCEIHTKAAYGPGFKTDKIIFEDEFDMNRNQEKVTFELDLVDKLNITDYENYEIPEFFIITTVECVHPTSGISHLSSEYVYYNVRNRYRSSYKTANYEQHANDNSADVHIQFRILRKGNWPTPLQAEDLTKPVNVHVKLPQPITDNLESPADGNFAFESMPSGGEINLLLKVRDFTTDFASIINQTVVEFEVDGEHNSYVADKWNQVVMPKLSISPYDPVASYSAGDIAKFNLCSNTDLPKGTRLNLLLSTLEEIDWLLDVREVALTKGIPEVLQIEIPQGWTKPTEFLLTVYGKCINQDSWDKSQNCIFQASTTFHVNIPRPIVSVVNVLSTMNESKLNLAINGLTENTTHVSIMLAKVDLYAERTWRGRYNPPSCLVDYNHELKSDTKKHYEVVSNARMKSETRDATQEGYTFEFPNPAVINNSLLLTLSLEDKTLDGPYSIKALAINNIDNHNTLVHSSPTLVEIPRSIITFHLPFFPGSLVVGDEVNLILWIKNPSSTKMNESINFKYHVEGHESNLTSFSRLVEINSESHATVEFSIQPKEVGKIILQIETSIGIEITKSLEVLPEGKYLEMITKYTLITNSPDLYNNIKKHDVLVSSTCALTTYENNSTTKLIICPDDIFGYLHTNYQTGKFSNLWLDTTEQKVHFNILKSYTYAYKLEEIEKHKFKGPQTSRWMEPFSELELSKISLVDYPEFTPNETSIFLMESYQFLLNAFKEWLGKGDPSQVGMKFVEFQNVDGSFKNLANDCRRVAISSSFVNETFTNTIIGVAALNKAKELNPNNNAIAKSFQLGLDYIEGRLSAADPDSSVLNDNYELSLLTYLYSTIGHKDSTEMFMKLKKESSSDDDGIYWTSQWVTEDSCNDSVVPRDFSLAATAYALQSYVNMNDSDSFEIAKWLVAKLEPNGIYESLEDTIVVLRSLAWFQEKSNVSFDLFGESVKHYVPLENLTIGIDFTLEKSRNESSGISEMTICLPNQIDQRVLITLPPRFVFRYTSVTEEPSPRLSYDGNEITFIATRPVLQTKGCFELTAYNMYQEWESSDGKDSQVPGKITVVDLKYPFQKAVKYFYL